MTNNSVETEEKKAEPGEIAATIPIVQPTYSVISYKFSELPSSYHPMLYSRWLRSLRFGNNLYKKIKSDKFYDEYKKYIGTLLNKPDCLMKMAVLSDDFDVVLGFSVSREDVLDYIHVHSDYRRLGIGRALFPDKITTFTHVTHFAIIIWQSENSKYKKLEYNPYA